MNHISVYFCVKILRYIRFMYLSMHASLMPLLGKRIMLIDDDPDTLTVLRMVLESWRANAEAFARPDYALEAFAKQPQSYDVLVTDTRMPQMNGIELADKVREIRPDQLVIFISAFEYDQETFGASTGAKVAEDLVREPVDVQILCSTVNKKLESK